MPLLHCGFFSQALGHQTSIHAIVPAPRLKKSLQPGPRRSSAVLYLLHGYSDDDTAWVRRSGIERYVDRLDLAVVMPNGHLSFYTDMAHGQRYFEYLTRELPAVVTSLFPVSAERSHTFIAGFSMGGYGALKAALHLPARYAAVATIGAVTDIAAKEFNAQAVFHEQLVNIFGDLSALAGSPHDLFHLAERAAPRRRSLPRILQLCATGDYLYADNLRFRDHLRRLRVPAEYEEGNGFHDWDYADTAVRRIVDWLPLPERA